MAKQVHNGSMPMLTTDSILKTLDKREFPSYKSLLESISAFWEGHAGRLPSEIGPRDVVAKAASMQLLQKRANGVVVVTHNRTKKTPTSRLAKKRAAR